MRLIDRATGRELQLGDIVELRGREYNLSGLDPKASVLYLFSDAGDGSPFPIKAAAIQAEFRA